MKPGYKTSEFWLTVAAMVVGGLMASGVLGNGVAMEMAGAASALLAKLGYTWSRASLKAAQPAPEPVAPVVPAPPNGGV